eukprot:gene16210-7270_t
MANVAVTVRPAALSEAPSLSKLIIDAYNETDLWYKKPEFKNRVDPDGAAVSELLAANHKGVVHVEWPDDGPASFGMLSVPKEYAGRGIGATLVRAAESRLSSDSITSLEIDVMATVGPQRTRNLVGCVEAPAWWTFAIAEEYIGKVMVLKMHKFLSALPLKV